MAGKITKIEIADELSRGSKAVEIANKSGLKIRTIEKYIELMKKESGASNSAHLVGIYFRKQLIN